MRKLTVLAALLAVALGAGLGYQVIAQQDPWYRPLNDQGHSLGVGYGTQYPSAATIGTNPADGELFVQLTSGATANPVLNIYSDSAGGWLEVSPVAGAERNLPTTLATNAPQVANSIWGASNGIVAEGATADAHEVTVSAVDPTSDQTYSLPVHTYGADTYYFHATTDGSLTTGYWTLPPRFSHTEDAVVDFTAGNDSMYVYRVYIDAPITVENVSVLLVDGGAIAAADIVGVAIYQDADAGTRLTTGTGDGTAAGLETIDVTDVTLYPGYYRLGICSSDATNLHVHATLQDDETIDVIAGIAGDITYGTAANGCTTGVPATTTGALSTADENIPVVILH